MIAALGASSGPAATTAARHVTGVDVVELVVAAVLAALGLRSLIRWLRIGFRPASAGEAVLYALHATARVAMWFAFAGFFAGYALVDEPQTFRVYIMVPLGLAAIQLLTALALGSPRGRRGPDRDPNGEPGPGGPGPGPGSGPA